MALLSVWRVYEVPLLRNKKPAVVLEAFLPKRSSARMRALPAWSPLTGSTPRVQSDPDIVSPTNTPAVQMPELSGKVREYVRSSLVPSIPASQLPGEP